MNPTVGVAFDPLREVDVRVIAATHKDLTEMVKKGQFREDLYYRINVIRIQVPPLRDRKDDLPILIDHFFRKHHRDGQRASRHLEQVARRLEVGRGQLGSRDTERIGLERVDQGLGIRNFHP